MKVMQSKVTVEVEALGTYYEEFTDYYTYAIDTDYYSLFDEDECIRWETEVKKSIIEDILKTHSSTYYYDYIFYRVYEFDGNRCRKEF